MRNKSRFAMTAATTGLVSAALLGGPMVAAASAAPTAPKPAATHSTAAQKRAETVKKYGVFPLPVSVREVNRYHLSKKQLKDIQKAKKLAKSPEARKIRKRESHSNYKINTGNGYYGAYQFDRGTWKHNGGGKFAKTANKAPAWAQDYVMWRTHKARGWSPWTTA